MELTGNCGTVMALFLPLVGFWVGGSSLQIKARGFTSGTIDLPSCVGVKNKNKKLLVYLFGKVNKSFTW